MFSFASLKTEHIHCSLRVWYNSTKEFNNLHNSSLELDVTFTTWLPPTEKLDLWQNGINLLKVKICCNISMYQFWSQNMWSFLFVTYIYCAEVFFPRVVDHSFDIFFALTYGLLKLLGNLVDFMRLELILVTNTFQVLIRMQQYKDDLLASCLRLVLSLPLEIVILDVASFVPALKVILRWYACSLYADVRHLKHYSGDGCLNLSFSCCLDFKCL